MKFEDNQEYLNRISAEDLAVNPAETEEPEG